MELKETIDLMLSEDYTERLTAEYLQTRIRFEKLNNLIFNAENDSLDFELTCDISLLKTQSQAMAKYLYYLEGRFDLEKIPFPKEYGPLGGIVWQ